MPQQGINGANGTINGVGGAGCVNGRRSLATSWWLNGVDRTVGPATPFAPSDIAGLTVWLKADAGLYTDAGTTLVSADGDLVYQWNDQSGIGNHVVQATSGKRPLYKVSIKNGLPVVRFDGSDDWMQRTYSGALSQPYTKFMVYIDNNQTNGRYIQDGSATNTSVLFHGSATTLTGYPGSYSVTVANATWYIAENVVNGASSTLKVNGGTPATGNHGSGTMGGLTIAAYGGAGPALVSQIDAAELLVYNSALSAADLTRVRNYLNTRWAIY